VMDSETMREVPREGETIDEVMFRGNIVMILCAGFLITTLVLILEHCQIRAGVERLSELRVSHDPSLPADPDLKLVSERSPYVRDER